MIDPNNVPPVSDDEILARFVTFLSEGRGQIRELL